MRIGLDVRALQVGGGSETRGIGRYVAGLVDSLSAHAPEVRLVLLGLEGRPLPEGWAERFEIVPVGGKVYERAAFPLYMRLPKVRSSQALLARLHGEAAASQRAAFEAAVRGARLDVLHLPTAVDIGSFPAGDFPVPVVATFLDAIPLLQRESLYETWAPFLRRFYDDQLADLRKAARVVAISEASRKDAIRFANLSPEKVRVVYPAVAPAYGIPVDEATRAAVRARYGLQGPFVLFCSVPDPHKNPERVVAAFARAGLSGATLAFVAPREEAVLARLDAFAAKYGLPASQLVVTGRVPETELVALFQSAAVLVSPSLVEGFGLPAAQALAAGMPAIVSSRGSQPEVVGDAGRVVDPEDVDAIAFAIRQLMTDEELRESLAERGRERARRFSPERQARELRAVYEEAMKAREADGRVAISILLTVYRRTAYLREALESALAQTFTGFEILVIDDSNSPEVAAIVASFSDPRVRYRPNPTNLGIAVSLREALPACQGRYVAILNDDDAWEPTFLARLIAPLEEDPVRDLAFCDFWTMDAEGTIDAAQSEEFSQTWGRADLPPGDVADFADFALVKMGVPIAMGALLRKSALDARELVPEVSGAYDFWIACLLAARGGRAFFVKERLSCYRLHPAMESDRRAADKNENLVAIYAALLRRDAFPALRLLLRQRLSIAHGLVARDAARFGRPALALRHRLAQLVLQPPIAAGRLGRLLRRVVRR